MDPSSRETEIKLLENALQLTELEVEEKALLLEHGHAEHAQYRELAKKDYASKMPAPSDPRLLEIELKKAQLRAERARIQLDAAKRSVEPDRNGSAGNEIAAESVTMMAWRLLGASLESERPDDSEPTGLRIIELREGGPADRAGLRVGDILRGLDRWETKSLANLSFVLTRQERAQEAGNPKHVKAIVRRAHKHYWTTVSFAPLQPDTLRRPAPPQTRPEARPAGQAPPIRALPRDDSGGR